MTSSFAPMDTPNQPPAAEGEAGLPQVCPPSAEVSPGEVDPGLATTANLRAGLASRLRTAYEQGARIDDLALACHQPVSEVRELLEQAGADPDAPAGPDRSAQGLPTEAGVVPQQRSGNTESLAERAAPADPAAWSSSAPRPRPRVRRPAPVRRAPRTGRGQGAGPGGLPAAAPADAVTAPVADPGAQAPETPPGALEPQLGILIGGGGRSTEPPTHSSGRRRVRAQVIRVGRGTTLALLPSWRSAIAVSVPTELLTGATGLSQQQLLGAELSVEINPEALHDRELRPTDWQTVPAPPTPRRTRD